MRNYLIGGLLGSITGDAMGVPYEFSSREEMKNKYINGMKGFGSHNQPPGTWSDDTSMALATMDSLCGGVDYEDMITKYCDWINYAKYTPHDEVFDYGRTTFYSLRNCWYEGLPALECGLVDERSNGNGSLMRILPVTYYCYFNKLSVDEQRLLIGNVSSLTHAHKTSRAGCNIYNFVIRRILEKHTLGLKDSLKQCILRGLDDSREYYDNDEYPEFYDLYHDIEQYSPVDVGSTGYVVDSLRTGLVVSLNTSDYPESIISTIRLGGDTDTNSMVTGGITGLYYGLNSVPFTWRDVLVKREHIENLCDKFINSLINAV